MFKLWHQFNTDEDGAVTVDWVVLTAAVVGLAVAAYGTISDGADALTTDTATYLTDQDISGGPKIQDYYGGGV